MFVWIGPTDYQPDIKHRGGLHDLAHARRIINARQLNQNLIIAESVLLDHRLTHTELVHTIPDRINRLLYRPLLQRGQLRGLHHDLIVIARTAGKVIALKRVADRISQCANFVRRHSADGDDFRTVLRIRLGDVGESDACLREILAQRLRHAIGFSIHSLIHCNLQDQVRPTLKVETKMNVLLNGAERSLLLPGRDGLLRIGPEENAVNKYKQHSDDEKCFR